MRTCQRCGTRTEPLYRGTHQPDPDMPDHNFDRNVHYVEDWAWCPSCERPVKTDRKG